MEYPLSARDRTRILALRRSLIDPSAEQELLP